MDIETNTGRNSVAEIELVYKPLMKLSDLPKISHSDDAYRLFIETWDKTKLQFVEQFKVMLLNRASRVLGICTVSTGGVAFTIADPRLIFAVTLKANACRIILAHNHPAGNLTPSRDDELLTRKIKEGGRYLDIIVEDHMIVSPEGYYSFADEGAL